SAAPIQETPFRSVRLGPSWLCRPCSFDSTTREHLNHRRAQVVEPTTCAQSARRGPPLPQFLFSGMAGWHVAALSATSSLRSATAPRSPPRCPTTTSARPSASLPSRPPRPHNQPNRRVRTRMHGGVGGEGPRGFPLSLFSPSLRDGGADGRLEVGEGTGEDRKPLTPNLGAFRQ